MTVAKHCSAFVVCFLAIAAISDSLRAESIAISNHSFELDPAFAAEGNQFWLAGPGHIASKFGRFNNGPVFGQLAPPTDGTQMAFFGGDGADVFQDLTAMYQANTDYLFQIDISARSPFTASQSMRLILYSDGILANEVTSLTLDGTQVINDQFNTYSFTATAAQVSAASAVGKTIGIRLLGTSSAAGDFDLDNVRLTATAIPEPASLGLISLVGLMLARRRGR